MITNQEAWKEWEDKNSDPYGKACVDVARRVMEILDDEPGEFDCHQIICRADDETKTGGITGFMAGAVASMVSQCHSRGEEFRLKWNGLYKTKGPDNGGVVNPAIMTISVE